MKVFVSFFRFILFLFSAILLLAGCKLDKANFTTLEQSYNEKRMVLLPEIPFGSNCPTIESPDVNRYTEAANYLKKISAEIGGLNESELDASELERMKFLKDDLNKTKDYLQASSHSWDPSFYNAGGFIKCQLANSKISDPCQQMSKVHNQLQDIPMYYEKAKSHLKKPSIKKTLLAIEKNSLGFHFLKNEVMDSLTLSNCNAINKEDFQEDLDASLIAIKDYVAFCNSLKFEYGEKRSEIVFRDSI